MGFDAARHIPARAPISVISLSAYADADRGAHLADAAAGYLVKPVPVHALRAALARALAGPSPPGQGLP